MGPFAESLRPAVIQTVLRDGIERRASGRRERRSVAGEITGPPPVAQVGQLGAGRVCSSGRADEHIQEVAQEDA